MLKLAIILKNEKLCPFEAVGCIMHVSTCRFLENFKNKLRPYQHPLNDETIDTSEDIRTNVSDDTFNIVNRVNEENVYQTV